MRRQPALDEIEMFVVEPPTSPWDDRGAGDTGTLGDTLDDTDAGTGDDGEPEAAAEREAIDDGSLAQRSGTGTWPNGDRAVRTGSCEEVLVTLPGDRLRALADTDPNSLFDERVRRFAVDRASLRSSRGELAWDGTVRTLTGRRRRASLRVYRSPSGNVTVITLVPTNPSKFFPTAFIRPGLRAMRDLSANITALT